MLNISPIIAEKADSIIEKWIDEVRQDRRLESSINLSDTALGDSLPKLLKSLAAVLHSSKENFSYLAHELKTPLTAVIGYSELLQRLQQEDLNGGPGSDSLSLRSIERVLQGGRHLLHIVNDSLELSRYEASQINLNLEWRDVRSIMTTVSEMLEPLVQAKGLQLKVDEQSAPDQVFTDPFRLQQILTNLLSNAIRYTDAGSIQVTCQTLSNQKWSLSVTDTGIGIAAEDQGYIFEPFSQAFFNQGHQQPESTGLGLAIVSRLVQLLRGEIHLVSELGVGSTFTVTLPLDIQA